MLIKHMENYQQTKPVYAGLKTAKNKERYHKEHEREIIIHETATRALKAALPEGGKLPNLATLKAEYARLTDKKNSLTADYAKLKRQARELGIIKANVDSIIEPQAAQRRTKRLSQGR